MKNPIARFNHTLGETNPSEECTPWRERSVARNSAPLLERDSHAFLHQSPSSPRVSTIKRAQDIWIENLDVCGDFAIGHYTHEKNTVRACAALTMPEIIEAEGLVERSAELGAYALQRLTEFDRRSPIAGSVLTLSPPQAISRLDLERALTSEIKETIPA